ncbi:hypothetical protein LEP1GSC133_0622 [Leptospira borgpetersenii serovar Pomona str. 200901868]|uniref:Uncharacterized protein n=1 Tax=Leptospira borgpetersenii serovar Pomona str. 200901868 TaxID=1192866 RepID=M6VU34_LEPBO|nr:hypothetical protein LEP1GSC133_0622 [Leptospira borgpetersenii serovar Pomona str. 200901868]
MWSAFLQYAELTLNLEPVVTESRLGMIDFRKLCVKKSNSNS